MNLYLDLGNTNLYIGIIEDEKVIRTFRTATDLKKSSDEYATIISLFLRSEEIAQNEIEGIVISSVVPSLNSIIKSAILKAFKKAPLFVEGGLKTGLAIRMDNPNEIGADLICDSVGAIAKYGYPLLIVDLGTASKIIVIDDKGSFAGGVIMPGLKIAMQALSINTANLPDVSLEAPLKIIGKNTPDAMNIGLVYGHIEMITGLCRKIEIELGYTCKHILTGGFAKHLSQLTDQGFVFDKHIVFMGMDVIYKKNVGVKNEK